MAQCQCGNQDLEYKSGVSKKTGKKWQGYKCQPCDLMMGMDGVPWGQKTATPAQNGFKPQTNGTPLNEMKSIVGKLDQIIAGLRSKGIIIPQTIEREDISELEDSPF